MSRRARDAVGVRQVYGKPVERDGVTVIPAATVFGGGGAGSGTAASREDARPGEEGSGFGFGLLGWASGAFEIRDGEVRWHPAVDRTWIIIALLMSAASIIRALGALRNR